MLLTLIEKYMGIFMASLVAIFSCATYAQPPIELKDESHGGANLSKLDFKTIESMFNAVPSTVVQDGNYLYFTIPSVGSFEVLPVRFEPVAEENKEMLLNSYRCGLVIVSPEYPIQALTTVGAGFTLLEECDGLTSLGVVSDKKERYHLGAIYVFRSPGIVSPGDIVMSWNENQKKWSVNDRLIDHESLPENITSMWMLQEELKK